MRPDSAAAVVDDLFARCADRGVSLALVASQGGEVVLERYGVQPASDFAPETPVTATSTLLSWSMAKSMTHAALGVLVADGAIDLDAPAAVPEWAGDERSAITPMQLLEMRSGLRFVEDYLDDQTSHSIEMLFGGTDPSFAHYAASQPLEHRPGEVFNYSSGTTNIVSRVIGDIVVRDAAGSLDVDVEQRRKLIEEFLHTRLFEPAGMSSATPKFDDAGDFVGSSYVYATARDFARFGELYLRDGVGPHGQRVLPAGWAAHAATWSGHDPDTGLSYGRHWWLWPAFPGVLACHGYEGQFIAVFPDRDLVLVHLGKTPAAYNTSLQMWLARIAELL